MSSSITVLGTGSVAALTTGLVIDAGTLAQLEQAQTVNLQSYGNINFQGNIKIGMSGTDASLTFGGAALASDGGQVTISSPMLVFDHELGTTITTSSTGTGALNIDVGQLVFGSGNKALTGFGSVSLIAQSGGDRAGHRQLRFRRAAGDIADPDRDCRHCVGSDHQDDWRDVGGSPPVARFGFRRARRCDHAARSNGERICSGSGDRWKHQPRSKRR